MLFVPIRNRWASKKTLAHSTWLFHVPSISFNSNIQRHQVAGTDMTKLWRFIKANGVWLLDAWRVWASFIVVFVVAVFASMLPGTGDDHVRYSGLVLQILGIATVVHGLRDRRRLFNRPSFIDHLFAWLAKRPRWGAKPQTISFSGTEVVTVSDTAKLSVWRGVPPDAPIDARLSALESNIETLKTEQAEMSKELQDETRKRVDALDSERRSRESADVELRTRVDTLGAGGLHLETAGLLWLIVGVVLGTVPAEIWSALKWLL